MVSARLGDVMVGDGHPTVIIGVINLDDSSFYRGSIVRGRDDLVKRAREMVEEGAEIIDIGAVGTGPTSRPVPEHRELQELIPAIKAVAKEISAPISADTQRAVVAEAAAEAGASIINDVSGFKADARMAEVVASSGCSAILMAARRLPGDVYQIGEIQEALRSSLKICREHGVPLKKVVVDPAFGQWPARLARLGPRARRRLRGRGYSLATFFDLNILANLERLKISRPICLSISRKSSIGDVLGLPDPEERLYGSLAAAAIAVLKGAHALRTHDPVETLHAARIAESIRDLPR